MSDNSGSHGIVVILLSIGLILASVLNITQDRKIGDLSTRLEVLEMKYESR